MHLRQLQRPPTPGPAVRSIANAGLCRRPHLITVATACVLLIASSALSGGSASSGASSSSGDRFSSVLKRLRTAESSAAGAIVGPGNPQQDDARSELALEASRAISPRIQLEGEDEAQRGEQEGEEGATDNDKGAQVAPLGNAVVETATPAGTPSEACISSALKWSVPRWADPEVNAVFVEVQQFIAAGLRGHGLQVNSPAWPGCLQKPAGHRGSCAGRVVVVTFPCLAAAIPSVTGPLPAGTRLVVANLEVLTGRFGCLADPRVRPLWSRWPVWEYSDMNVDALTREGLLQKAVTASGSKGTASAPNVAVLSLGHYQGLVAPEFEAPPSSQDRKSVQVLLLADVNARRKRILDSLRSRGISVMATTGVYGRQRDALVRSADVVLNVHYFSPQSQHLMEAVRLFCVLSTGAAVVSEGSPDARAAAHWSRAVRVSDYMHLVEATVSLLQNATERLELASRGHALMREAPPRDRIAPALRMALRVLGDAGAKEGPCSDKQQPKAGAAQQAVKAAGARDKQPEEEDDADGLLEDSWKK